VCSWSVAGGEYPLFCSHSNWSKAVAGGRNPFGRAFLKATTHDAINGGNITHGAGTSTHVFGLS
jgi:hypothetical protein